MNSSPKAAWDFSGRRPFEELSAEERLMELGRQIVFVKTWQGKALNSPLPDLETKGPEQSPLP